MLHRRWYFTLAMASLATLVVVPAAHGGPVNLSTDASGLAVVAQDTATSEELTVDGQSTPEGTIAFWRVTRSDCASDLFCFEHGVTCTKPFNVARDCRRDQPGVRATLRGGNDRLLIRNTAGDAVTVDAGDGNDAVRASTLSQGLSAVGTWTVALGTGNDTYEGSLGRDSVTGGSGEDDIVTGQGNDFVQAGSGNDTVSTSLGNDSVKGEAGNDVILDNSGLDFITNDSYDGGGGFDTLDYRFRINSILAVKVAETATASGESDGVISIERIVGGRGNDSLLGFSSSGGDGDDVLTGDNGNNSITGGPGADTIRGFGGDDTLDANDGVRDTRIDCSTGADKVTLDLTDPNPADEQCEKITRIEVGGGPATVIVSGAVRLEGRRASVRLRCPRRPRGRLGCSGTLRMVLAHDGSDRPRSTRYRVRNGKSRAVTVSLAPAEARRVHRAGRARAIVTSRERGRIGPETVLRKITVR